MRSRTLDQLVQMQMQRKIPDLVLQGRRREQDEDQRSKIIPLGFAREHERMARPFSGPPPASLPRDKQSGAGRYRLFST